MEKEKFNQLIDRTLAGTATPEEQVLLESYYHQLTQGRTELEPEEMVRLRTVVLDKILRQTTKQSVPMHRNVWVRYAAAAVVLFAIATTYLLLNNKTPTPALSQAERFKNDIAPGRTGAILTLANGQSILLDTAKNGNILGHFSKGDSVLSVQTTIAQYATLSTPEARTEKLQLGDGTTVYLNASSSIRFPTVFTKGSPRIVEITGEAYFEVKHNAAMPFRVKLPDGSVVEDLGTSFNINAYGNEGAIKTTLVEGAVNISNNGATITLKPGDQAATQNGKFSTVLNFDMDQTLAWKNGLFTYNGADMETIMRQVSRWYGVEVAYEDKIEDEFVADLPRDVPISKLLNALEGTGKVHFKIEGKKITVSK